ncbi:hypothetical protein FoTM2_003927 [Fusarium oxysporum f. sp. vasinfectum]|nr:hypothetical protein FoTM2_003927 [Fusarium oxysporum f. sp. vasinfectum]
MRFSIFTLVALVSASSASLVRRVDVNVPAMTNADGVVVPFDTAGVVQPAKKRDLEQKKRDLAQRKRHISRKRRADPSHVFVYVLQFRYYGPCSRELSASDKSPVREVSVRAVLS